MVRILWREDNEGLSLTKPGNIGQRATTERNTVAVSIRSLSGVFPPVQPNEYVKSGTCR
jgi:hypothetical protein